MYIAIISVGDGNGYEITNANHYHQSIPQDMTPE